MNRCDKLIKDLYKDIFITIGIVLATIPLWWGFDTSEAYNIAKYYDNYDYITYEIVNPTDHNIEMLSDTEGLAFVETEDIEVYNFSNTEDDYYLLVKTNCDVDNIRINVNNEVKFLTDYESFKDDSNTYYILDYSSLVAGNYRYNVSLWCMEDTFNNNIDYELLVKGRL